MGILRSFTPLALAVASLGWSGCGAGLIVGVVAGGGGSSDPPAPGPPELTLSDPQAPLVVPSGLLSPKLLLISNFALPIGAQIRIEMRGLGVTSIQANPVPLSSTQTGSSIGFFERHDEILAQVPISERADANVATSIVLFVDGAQVGQALPFALIRQRSAVLDPPYPGANYADVSVLGTTRVRLRISALDGSEQLDGVSMLLGSPGGTPQVATNVIFSRLSATEWSVSGIVPPSLYPTQLFVQVADSTAGLSTVVSNVYYHPEVLAATPRSGPTTGGGLMTLVGQGLVPLLDPTDPTGPLDFSKVTIRFRKGSRELDVPSSALLAELSSLNQLVFPFAPSPDGAPGLADVLLLVDLAGVVVQDEVKGFFSYRQPAPGFGPRGALLPGVATAIGWADIEAPRTGPLDALVLTHAGGGASVDALGTLGNGMFTSLGPPIVAADPMDPLQRQPVDLAAGEFDGDGLTDVVVWHAGDATVAAHSVLLGQSAPKPPLQLAQPAAAGAAAALARVGDFDRDGVSDFVVVPDPQSGSAPQLFLARPQGPGLPRFSRVSLNGSIATNAPYDAAMVDDLDGDGCTDLVFVRGGTAMKLIVGYGDGAGGVAQQVAYDMTVPGYSPAGGAPVVGVHAQHATSPHPLAVVFGGDVASPAAVASVAVFHPDQQRSYRQPNAGEVLLLNGVEPLAGSVSGDLDGVAGDELVLAGSPGSSEMMRLLRWDGTGYQEVVGGVAPTIEPIVSIASLAIGWAATQPPARALFAYHDLQSAAGIEHRLGTWVAVPGPALLAPDVSCELPDPIEALVTGRFSGQSNGADDVVLALAGRLRLLVNDGIAGLAPGNDINLASVVPESMVTLPAAAADRVVAIANDGQLAVIDPATSGLEWSGVDFRSYASPASATWNVGVGSRLYSADVDADGVADVVVVMALKQPSGSARETLILLLRGNGQASGWPFFLPDGRAQATVFAEEAAAGAFGDFASDTAAQEFGLAIKLGATSAGNEVRFYHYDAGAAASQTDDRLVRSSALANPSSLIGGDDPRQLLGADFDKDGDADLAVAFAGEARLRVFLNSGVVDPTRPGEVIVGAFVEAPGSTALPPGEPVSLFSGDLDGDGTADLVAVTRDLVPEVDNNVACYISTGTGGLTILKMLPHLRTGNQVVGMAGAQLRNADVASGFCDLNGDGLDDLLFGWQTAAPGDRNLRVLLGAAR